MNKMVMGMVLGLGIAGLAACSTTPQAPTGYEKVTNTALAFDILKQKEKLDKDPDDIKQSDIYKFQYVCTNENFWDAVKTTLTEKPLADVVAVCVVIVGK